jgi:hypothetical protein
MFSVTSQPNLACYLLHVGILIGLFIDPEDGGDIFLRNVGRFSTNYTALYRKIVFFIVTAVRT